MPLYPGTRAAQSRGRWKERQLTASSAAVRTARQRVVRRELLTGLVRKDLKVKYQGSVLGFTWSLANPLLTLAVYSFVFGLVLKAGIPDFGFYLMCGLLLWNAFSTAVGSATASVVANAGLVKKVPFPLGVLPLSSVAFAIVHYLLQLLVLIVVMVAFKQWHHWDAGMVLLPGALLVVLVFTIAISYLVAALNVRYRDTQHIVDVVLLAGMWLNPIVYSATQLRTRLEKHHLWFVYFLNPMADVVVAAQRALYGTGRTYQASTGRDPVLPDQGLMFYVIRLGVGLVVSAVVLVLTYRLYHRMSSDFAEEL
jgi:ABC-2 type transport system permease protein